MKMVNEYNYLKIENLVVKYSQKKRFNKAEEILKYLKQEDKQPLIAIIETYRLEYNKKGEIK